MSKFSQYDTVRLVKPNSYLIDQGFKTRTDYNVARIHSQMGRLQLFGLFVRNLSLSNPVRLIDENGNLTGAGECFELLSVIEAKQRQKKSIEIGQVPIVWSHYASNDLAELCGVNMSTLGEWSVDESYA